MYDPAGGWEPGLGGDLAIVEGKDADRFSYINYQNKTGDVVYAYLFQTTEQQEQQIMNNAANLPYAPPFTCSKRTSSAIQGVGPFKSITPTFFPGNLGRALAALTGASLFIYLPQE
jgi:hypothetical protein